MNMMQGTNNIKKALVIGMGYRTGLAAANFLAAKGVAVTASDSKPAAELADVLTKLDPSVRVVVGGQDPALIGEGFDAVILSPGVPRSIPLVAEAYRRSIPVMAEVELAWRNLAGSVVGITGTDGKSTTTALAGHLFRELGFDAHVGGNIGIPLISFAGKTAADSVIVAELSSFQLEAIIDFRPDAALLLNVTPDHLDRYDSMNDYFRAKMRIAMNQTADDSFIYNRDDERACASAATVASRALSFSSRSEDADIYYRDGTVLLREGGRTVLEAGRLAIMGLHNVENAMAAVLAVLAVMKKRGMVPDYDRIARAAYTFPGLEHRLERVGSYRDREFINDSKATTVNAVLTALKSLKGQGVLILGGRTKGDDYSKIAAGLDGRIRSLVLIGESRESFSKIFSGYRQVTAGTMDDAVAAAMRESREGDVILLSPACASFDMYKNYEERGAAFRESLRRLSEGVIAWT